MEVKHDWEKKNFEPIHSKGRHYDRLECRNCGAKARRFGKDIELDARSQRLPHHRDCISAPKFAVEAYAG
jgi:hypothetical protein